MNIFRVLWQGYVTPEAIFERDFGTRRLRAGIVDKM
jgi:hypothetical protein